MKCVVLLVATTIFCQFVRSEGRSNPVHRERRGYFERPRPHDFFAPGDIHDGSFHPSWWRNHKYHRPAGPYENPFGFPHRDFSGDEELKQHTDPISSKSNNGKDKASSPTSDKPYPGNSDIFSLSTEKTLNKTEQIELCIRLCSVTSEYNPVCGSNNVTYVNPGRLECAQRCGVEVQLSRLTACSAPVETNSDTDSREVLIACLRQCPVTIEYNPVCGTNNVTYVNPGRLICAQGCGVQVELKEQSPCSATLPEPITTEKNEQEILTCIRSCPVTGEYNPVCGSNSVTYTNIGRLECAQRCGLAVTVIRKTFCFAPLTIGEFDSVINKRDDNDVTMLTQNTTAIIQESSVNSTTTRPFTNENSKIASGKEAKNDSDQNRLNYGNDTNGDNNLNSENGDNNPGVKDSGNGDSGNDAYDSNTDQDDNVDNYEAPLFSKGFYGGGGYGGSNANTGSSGGNNGHGGHVGNHGNSGNNCNGASNQKMPNVQELMECMQLCTLTSELNPVCGTDGITYTNPGRLLCAQFCGIDVKVKKFAPCSYKSNTYFSCPSICPSTSVTDDPMTDTSLSPSVQACMDACPASTDYKPVCGTNYITYRNLEKMQCARRCGIDVSLLKNTHCSAPDTTSDGNPPVWTNTEKPTNSSPQIIQECINQCSVPQNYDPICGTDNVTYNSTGHLICARQCGLDIKVKYLTPCLDDKSPPPKPTTEKLPVNSTPHSANVTISPDILANIWPEITTPKDDSEEFDLDQRVQDN